MQTSLFGPLSGKLQLHYSHSGAEVSKILVPVIMPVFGSEREVRPINVIGEEIRWEKKFTLW